MEDSPPTAPQDGAPERPPTTRYVLYEWDGYGSPYAVEVVEAERWEAEFLEPPSERADVRVVRLRGGEPPAELPRWIAVEVDRDRAAAVTSGDSRGAPDTAAAEDEGQSREAVTARGAALWPWSPHYREPGASLNEFLSAGAIALRDPDPSPADPARQLELISDFAGGQASPLAQVATLRGDALARWLRYAHRDPDRFAEALLLGRIGEAAAPEVVEALRFLADAEVPGEAAEYAELAIDRLVLREQASPRRYFVGGPFAAALTAVQAWRRRYRLAYDAHYRAMVRRADGVSEQLEAARPVAAALERLDGIRALGAPVGRVALERYHVASAAIEALPPSPHPTAAQTGGVALGREPAALAQAREAVAAVGGALETQRRRLASATARRVLERRGVPALDRLLQALAAGDVGGMEHVLDERMAAHIDRLFAGTEQEAEEASQWTPEPTGPQVEAALGVLHEEIDRYRALMHDAQTGIMFFALDETCQLSNVAAQRILGYTAEQLRALTRQELVHPDDMERHVEHVAELQRSGAVRSRTRVRLRRQDGRFIPVDISVGTRAVDGEAVGWLVEFRELAD